jgi:hypothetical protein
MIVSFLVQEFNRHVREGSAKKTQRCYAGCFILITHLPAAKACGDGPQAGYSLLTAYCFILLISDHSLLTASCFLLIAFCLLLPSSPYPFRGVFPKKINKKICGQVFTLSFGLLELD